ncbi:hypothetical protein EmuJ_000682200 [Echinococcus multilocularis]|uniref:Uncharacterized protein n=1 Tax=Echinococcus multilocularis TaxID=6211 RepID=A0A068YAS5_ECHMU|nr:hypothetical protein EmuJ_000682200 [Echinococcus multilocularis]
MELLEGWIEIDDEDVAQCRGLADGKEGEVEESSGKWIRVTPTSPLNMTSTSPSSSLAPCSPAASSPAGAAPSAGAGAGADDGAARIWSADYDSTSIP